MSRLAPRDALRVGGSGLRTRPVRVVLSALGIALGIAAMIAVLGISASSRADLQRTLDRLGTNLLTVTPGTTMFGDDAHLPVTAPAMVSRIGPVTSVSTTGAVEGAHVYRTDKVPGAQTSGVGVLAARPGLLATVGGTVRSGTWLNAATARYPTVVLGSLAAERLGIPAAGGAAGAPAQVWLGGRWFTVIGILDAVPLAEELDSAALIGFEAAATELGFDGYPTTVYERSRDDAVAAVRDVLPRTVNPESPTEVQVSSPSDALAARYAADEAFTGLLLGLGAVALLVGGIGVANTMVIAVLERRTEIGLRRALGATRGNIRGQFLTESVLLSALGGLTGVLLGAVVTAGYATVRGWPVEVPSVTLGGALAVTLLVGALAGWYPAARAARLAPTTALATA